MPDQRRPRERDRPGGDQRPRAARPARARSRRCGGRCCSAGRAGCSRARSPSGARRGRGGRRRASTPRRSRTGRGRTPRAAAWRSGRRGERGPVDVEVAVSRGGPSSRRASALRRRTSVSPNAPLSAPTTSPPGRGALRSSEPPARARRWRRARRPGRASASRCWPRRRRPRRSRSWAADRQRGLGPARRHTRPAIPVVHLLDLLGGAGGGLAGQIARERRSPQAAC